VAEKAIQRAASHGAVGKALCGTSVSAILRDLPGFEGIRQTYFPGKLMDSFGQLPGVRTERFEDGDADNNKALLAAQAQQGG
jgi:hypothetical protein